MKAITNINKNDILWVFDTSSKLPQIYGLVIEDIKVEDRSYAKSYHGLCLFPDGKKYWTHFYDPGMHNSYDFEQVMVYQFYKKPDGWQTEKKFKGSFNKEILFNEIKLNYEDQIKLTEASIEARKQELASLKEQFDYILKQE